MSIAQLLLKWGANTTTSSAISAAQQAAADVKSLTEAEILLESDHPPGALETWHSGLNPL
jgi:hypothetical protein